MSFLPASLFRSRQGALEVGIESKFPHGIEDGSFPQGMKPPDFAAFPEQRKPCLFKIALYQKQICLNTTAVLASECPDPGLKAPIFGPFFRGLKPPAPSGIFDLQLYSGG
jgi:hypothetical protein